MGGMNTSPISTLMHDYLAAARSGDWDAAFALMADDVVLTVPGRSRYAGRHEGKAALREYLSAALAGTTGVQVELEDMLAGEEHIALVLRERLARGDRELNMRRTNLYRIRDGAIVEVSIFEAHQYEVDEFMEAQPART